MKPPTFPLDGLVPAKYRLSVNADTFYGHLSVHIQMGFDCTLIADNCQFFCSAIVNFTKFRGSREHIYENTMAEVVSKFCLLCFLLLMLVL